VVAYKESPNITRERLFGAVLNYVSSSRRRCTAGRRPHHSPPRQCSWSDRQIKAPVPHNVSADRVYRFAPSMLQFAGAATPRLSLRLHCHEIERAIIRAQLLCIPPPGIIFTTGGGPTVFVRLQTADHIRRASPVQKAQRATAPIHRAGIMRFPVGEQNTPILLVRVHRRQRIFSPLL
jgi:hypothetical protein